MKPVLKTGDLAALSGYHPKSISRLASQGKIDGNRANPGCKQIWFINDERIQRWLEGLSEQKRRAAKVKRFNQLINKARAHFQNAAQHFLILANKLRETGILLQTAKSNIPRAQWKSYLRREFDGGEVEARAYIALAKRYPEEITDVRIATTIASALNKRLKRQT